MAARIYQNAALKVELLSKVMYSNTNLNCAHTLSILPRSSFRAVTSTLVRFSWSSFCWYSCCSIILAERNELISDSSLSDLQTPYTISTEWNASFNLEKYEQKCGTKINESFAVVVYHC